MTFSYLFIGTNEKVTSPSQVVVLPTLKLDAIKKPSADPPKKTPLDPISNKSQVASTNTNNANTLSSPLSKSKTETKGNNDKY